MLPPSVITERRADQVKAIRKNPSGRAALSLEDWRKRTQAEARTRPSDERAKREFGMLRGMTRDPEQGLRIAERILKGNDLVSVNYLERGVQCARSVCRIELRSSDGLSAGFATGFLAAPGVLLTNHHVLPTAEHARHAVAQFNFEHDGRGGDRAPVVFEFDLRYPPIISGKLDFCLIGVKPVSNGGGESIETFGWLALDPTPGKTKANEFLTIIQHPGGERKQVCVRENRLIKYFDDALWYQTDTVSGSSGSPVFNNSWQVVALHSSGVPVTNAKGEPMTVDGRVWDPSTMRENDLAWLANAGIRISSIVAHLRARHAQHPHAQVTLARPTPPMDPPGSTVDTHGRRATASITIPVVVNAEFMDAAGAPPALPAAGVAADDGIAPLASLPPGERLAAALWLEVSKHKAVGVIESYPDRTGDDLSDRKGFLTNFLGSGKLLVPLPVIKSKKPFNTPFVWKGSQTVLPYGCHSVVLSQQRRLAIYSIVNVDDTQRFTQPEKDPGWIADPRTGGHEVGKAFYETDLNVRLPSKPSRKNPFDRGHQTQQEDATWGTNATSAARRSSDTFYFPNAAPQLADFNQAGKGWQGLEDYVIEIFAAETGRATVISGPVFDAPAVKPTFPAGVKGTPVDPTAKRKADPVFAGVQVPRVFYKIVVCLGDGRLHSAAFLMSQDAHLNLLKGKPMADPLETLTTPQARLFHVRIKDVETLTGLDFGANVRAGELSSLESLGDSAGRELRALADLRFF